MCLTKIIANLTEETGKHFTMQCKNYCAVLRAQSFQGARLVEGTHWKRGVVDGYVVCVVGVCGEVGRDCERLIGRIVYKKLEMLLYNGAHTLPNM